jgi:hypothetical protein
MLIADLPGACSLGEQVKHVWELEEVASAVLGAEAMVARDMVRYQADLEATRATETSTEAWRPEPVGTLLWPRGRHATGWSMRPPPWTTGRASLPAWPLAVEGTLTGPGREGTPAASRPSDCE